MSLEYSILVDRQFIYIYKVHPNVDYFFIQAKHHLNAICVATNYPTKNVHTINQTEPVNPMRIDALKLNGTLLR